MDEDFEAIIIDNGSGICKAGISDDENPKSAFPSIIGKPRSPSITIGKDSYVGEEAQANKNLLKLSYPIERGIITNWDDIEKIWHHCFYNELREDPEMHPCLLTEPPLNPKTNREKMIQSFFETFNVPKFYVQIPGVLSLYSSGKVSGLILDSGDTVTYTLPIFEGFTLLDGIQRVNFAGRNITENLYNILQEESQSLNQLGDKEIVKTIKEKLCYVAQDYQNESFKETQYELPDGRNLQIKNQLFTAPEALFNPYLVLSEAEGVHELIYNSLQKYDLYIRTELQTKIQLAGGSTMFSGYAERLLKNIQALLPSTAKIKVERSKKFSAWIGGSILTSLSSFKYKWITKAEYDEAGPNIVFKKCF